MASDLDEYRRRCKEIKGPYAQWVGFPCDGCIRRHRIILSALQRYPNDPDFKAYQESMA